MKLTEKLEEASWLKAEVASKRLILAKLEKEGLQVCVCVCGVCGVVCVCACVDWCVVGVRGVCVWMDGCWVVLYIMLSTIRSPRWPVLTCLCSAPRLFLSPPPLSHSPTVQVEKETRSEAHVKSRLRQSIDEVTEMPDVEDYILQKKEMCVLAHHFLPA
jgi:hypothetical protein